MKVRRLLSASTGVFRASLKLQMSSVALAKTLCSGMYRRIGRSLFQVLARSLLILTASGVANAVVADSAYAEGEPRCESQDEAGDFWTHPDGTLRRCELGEFGWDWVFYGSSGETPPCDGTNDGRKWWNSRGTEYATCKWTAEGWRWTRPSTGGGGGGGGVGVPGTFSCRADGVEGGYSPSHVFLVFVCICLGV